jgi:two-component system LytT family sensor kinase
MELDVDPGALDAKVPVLILQPLIENAVKHGILATENGGTIRGRVKGDRSTLRLSVEDSGPGSARAAPAGLGLVNTRSRLRELYGENARLELSRLDCGGTAAVIEINLALAMRSRADDPHDYR